ncbi:MAG: acyl-CoA dehydrogenase family protein, partial [Kineosporiaceae bacterium]
MRRHLFDDEHEAFRDSFRRFLDKEVVPQYGQWERSRIVPREVFQAAGGDGFLGMAVPEEYGGGGVDDFRFNVVIAEETARAGVTGFGLGISLHNDIVLPYLLSFTTDQQKARWLPGIASGELITAVAMTEPEMGSDLASMRTTAVRDGDAYVV